MPATGPYHEPDESNPHLSTLFPKIHPDIIFPSTLRSSEWSLPFKGKQETHTEFWLENLTIKRNLEDQE
jgi:hypothetical protein